MDESQLRNFVKKILLEMKKKFCILLNLDMNLNHLELIRYGINEKFLRKMKNTTYVLPKHRSNIRSTPLGAIPLTLYLSSGLVISTVCAQVKPCLDFA